MRSNSRPARHPIGYVPWCIFPEGRYTWHGDTNTALHANGHAAEAYREFSPYYYYGINQLRHFRSG